MKSFRPKQFNRQGESSISDGGGNNAKIQIQDSRSQDSLRLTPLGGVGDVTKNMYVYEYKDDIVVVDCGIGFPDEGMPGVDLVIPDINYLRDKKQRIRAILITHGHDDHIGGLPYLWPELDVPIYCQRLTAGMIKSKFAEHKLPTDKIKTINLGDEEKLGAFTISFYQVAHSIPDSTGIILKTPVGNLIHQADFKIDWTPVNGQVTDVGRVASIGNQGVLFLAIDCLRVEKPGYTLSEKTIESTFAKFEQETLGKLLITMTSSNITRIQQAVNVAVNSGRKIAISGRSMEMNFQVARDLGYLNIPPNLVVAQEQIKQFPDEKLMILIAGSQGQPGSSLSRVANRDHKYIQLKKGDSVVISADPIPSSESAQNALIDILSLAGANVYYTAVIPNLHVSGHASAEEIKLMINLARPKYLLPIGGTFRHMKAFLNMAKDLGYKENQILMVEDGDMIEMNQSFAKVNGKVNVSNVYIDGLGVGDVGGIVLRDRRLMSEEGVVVVVVPVDSRTSQITGDVDIISRGFVFEKGAEDLLEAAKEIVKSVVSEHKGPVDYRYLRHNVEENLEKFFYAELKRDPLILTIITEV